MENESFLGFGVSTSFDATGVASTLSLLVLGLSAASGAVSTALSFNCLANNSRATDSALTGSVGLLVIGAGLSGGRVGGGGPCTIGDDVSTSTLDILDAGWSANRLAKS